MTSHVNLIVAPTYRGSLWSVREHGKDRAWRRFPIKRVAVAVALRKGGLNYRVTVMVNATVESVYTRETYTS